MGKLQPTRREWTALEIKDAIIAGYYGEDGYASGITAVSQETEDVKDDATYDLQGKRVTSPDRGVYIKNGRKFVVRQVQ